MRNPVEKFAITRIYRDTFNLWQREIFPSAFRILKSSEKTEKGGND